jgi:gamma-glutamyl-gamma-aminobutyrate hydrolase PuuD
MNNKKVYIVGGDTSYLHIFDIPLEQVNSIEEAEFAIFTGGADVNPTLYGEIPHPTTGVNYARDMAEKIEFNRILEAGIPMVGICRGAQFLTVMAGGKLVQNVSGQPFFHNVTDIETTEEFEITSTHHQLMHPFLMDKKEYEILAYSNGLINLWEGLPKGEKTPEFECEIVYYPKINALCIQGHPEYPEASEKFKSVCRYYYQTYCRNYTFKKKYNFSLKNKKMGKPEYLTIGDYFIENKPF